MVGFSFSCMRTAAWRCPATNAARAWALALERLVQAGSAADNRTAKQTRPKTPVAFELCPEPLMARRAVSKFSQIPLQWARSRFDPGLWPEPLLALARACCQAWIILQRWWEPGSEWQERLRPARYPAARDFARGNTN